MQTLYQVSHAFLALHFQHTFEPCCSCIPRFAPSSLAALVLISYAILHSSLAPSSAAPWPSPCIDRAGMLHCSVTNVAAASKCFADAKASWHLAYQQATHPPGNRPAIWGRHENFSLRQNLIPPNTQPILPPVDTAPCPCQAQPMAPLGLGRVGSPLRLGKSWTWMRSSTR
jgi:hypothetical protein